MANTLNAAALAYRGAAVGAWEDLLDETAGNYKIFTHNQERIDHGGTVAGDAFENPTFDYEVCFAAGTQVLMADGTTKSIELLRPGDLVLAAHHLNPEERPTAAKVVRFFDNGEKDVVKLLFDKREEQTGSKTEEVICTPNHRFYVVGKGWVIAQELRQGDFCLSASGEKIAFVSKEILGEKQRVYNFEVEERHTYYIVVQKGYNVLAHNECWAWEMAKGFGDGLVQGFANLVNGIQDVAIDMTNLAIAIPNNVACVEERLLGMDQSDPIRIPNIPSPDWSRGLITAEYGTKGSWEDTHSWSKIAGSNGVMLFFSAISSSKLLQYSCPALSTQPLILEIHYDVRELANNNQQFRTITFEKIHNCMELEVGKEISIFDEETNWEKLSPENSRFHGKGCTKLVAKDGRELVISKGGYVEFNPQFIGTYNFCVPGGNFRDVGHGVVDVIPYMIYGNSLEDPTNIFERILMIFSKPEDEQESEEK